MDQTTVTTTVADLGIETTTEGKELWAQCPMHYERTGKQDKNPSWSINAETGAHYCFSCGYSGNLYVLVRDLGGEEKAASFRNEIEEIGHVGGTFKKGDIKAKIRSLRARDRHEKGVSETALAIYSTDVPDWALEARDIDKGAAHTYGVRWEERTESWVTPFYHPDGYLVGYQIKAQNGRRFRNSPKEMEKSSTLFGIQVVANEPVILVVESPLDAVRLYGLGYPAVAVAGSKVSAEQIEILSEFDTLVISLDNDSAGDREHKRLKKVLGNHGVNARWARSVAYKDPGEMPVRDIDALYRRYFRVPR